MIDLYDVFFSFGIVVGWLLLWCQVDICVIEEVGVVVIGFKGGSSVMLQCLFVGVEQFELLLVVFVYGMFMLLGELGDMGLCL